MGNKAGCTATNKPQTRASFDDKAPEIRPRARFPSSPQKSREPPSPTRQRPRSQSSPRHMRSKLPTTSSNPYLTLSVPESATLKLKSPKSLLAKLTPRGFDKSPQRSPQPTPRKKESLDEALDLVSAEESEFTYLAKLTFFDEETLRKLHKTFLRISGSQVDDGVIDCDEFAHAIGLTEGSLLVKRLFAKFDVTRTGKLNFREFSQAMSMLSDKAPIKEKIRFSFDLYDLNKDDKIEFNELRDLVVAALDESGVHLSDETIDTVCRNTITQTDEDENGTIEFMEYQVLCEQHPRLLYSFSINVDELIVSSQERKRSSAAPRVLRREAPKVKEKKGFTHLVGKLHGSGKAEVIKDVNKLEL